MAISGQIRESDYVAAQWIHIRPNLLMSILGVILMAIIIWTLFLDAPIVSICILILIAIYFGLIAPWYTRRIFRKYKALSEKLEIDIQDSGLHFKRETGEGLMPWSHIIKWKRNKTLVLLYPTDNVFIMIPSHLFPNNGDFTAFVSILEKHVGKEV
jgi:ABC-type bacteriocin/lantibiotic exporter with double-glycine peptidase domain